MKALKTVAVALGITLAAMIVKVTEEDDEDILELDREGA